MAFGNPGTHAGYVGSDIIRLLLIHFALENYPQIHRYIMRSFVNFKLNSCERASRLGTLPEI